MSELEKRIHLGVIVALVGLLALMPSASQADESDQADEGGTGELCSNPVALNLAENVMHVDCALLEAKGVGLGQIMKAWYLSKQLPGSDWEELLANKQAGIGWGQMKMAVRLGDDTASAEQLLAARQETGLGWGQIKQAQAITAALAADDQLESRSFEEILAMFDPTNNVGWGEIRATLNLPPGPPPWANGGKQKHKDALPATGVDSSGRPGQGPPPWANNDKEQSPAEPDSRN